MSDPVPIVAWGLRTTARRSTWHFYYQFMLIENYLITGKTDIKTGTTVYSVVRFDADWEAREEAIRLTEMAEEMGYSLIEDPLQHPIELDVREWLTEIIGHRDNNQILSKTYQDIRDLGRPLDGGTS